VKAARIHEFGSPEVIRIDDVPQPTPNEGEILVRVAAAGVGPWDALLREGKIAVSSPLPLILGSDLSGVVERMRPGLTKFNTGDQVYGVTNSQFLGAYAEYAVASETMVARKPTCLSFVEAASAPVVAVTAWQMLFDHAHARAGQTVLIHGAAGNVGAYAVQMARNAGLEVFATASSKDLEYVRGLGAGTAIDYHATPFEEIVREADIVLDTVGGDTRVRSIGVLKRGGILVSVVSSPMPEDMAAKAGVRAVYFIVDVTTDRLATIAELFDRKEIVPQVGTVLPLVDARVAHKMLAGAPHGRGKIVLDVAARHDALPGHLLQRAPGAA
jgi:NADPH:quinone reductase-like Zn-dependent oxidoreductase